MPTKEEHIEIAKGHKHFMQFAGLALKNLPNKCKPEAYCCWIVTAAYYRVLHLIEAVFDKHKQHHVANDEGADSKRSGLLLSLGLQEIRKQYKGLRRLALYAKYRPNNSPHDYDVIAQPDKTQTEVVDGYLKTIELLVARELGVDLEHLDPP
jgi:hypothetical protein